MSGPGIHYLQYGLPRSIQAKMALRAAGGGVGAMRPLGNLNSAMRDLDLSNAEINELLDQQALMGFDIALEFGGFREVRVLTRSLEHFRQTGGRPLPPMEWPEIYKLIFPAAAGPVPPRQFTGMELKQALNCSRPHVQNLSLRYFQILRPARKGRGNTPIFQADSVEQWLKGRMF